jgi:hypothetical protein
MAPNPAVPPTTPSAADAYDLHSGVYGFFRRHQKKLLYTAGLFVLLTFSITGPMMQLVGELFSGARPASTILVNGKRVEITAEDEVYGQLVANSPNAVPPGVIPWPRFDDENNSQRTQIFSLMRRAAIEEGIGVSMAEVDRAIENLRDLVKSDSAAKLARDLGMGSLARYRTLVAEAMRIGTWLRLQTLALDTTDARVMAKLTKGKEKITLRVASIDEKELEASMKAASPIAEADLDAWFAGKSDPEKMQMQAFDLPRVELRFGALLFGEGQFDATQWQDAWLKDFTVTDEQLQKYYAAERDTRFKLEGDNQWKPFDDAAVKAELTALAQAEHVMNQLLGEVKSKLGEVLRPLDEEITRTQQALAAAETAVGEASAKVATHELDLAKKTEELAAKPDDQALKDAIAKVQTDLDAAKTEAQAAKEKLPPLATAVEAATQAQKDARANFDFPAAFTALTAGKTGFVQKAITGTKTAEELKDLDALGTELGQWPLSAQGAQLAAKGDLCQFVGRTSKAVILYQATAAEPRPLKPKEQLQALVAGAYWTEKARTEAQERKKKMDEALLRLAKEKIADKVAEIEAKQQSRVDEKLAEWEKKTTDAIAAAQATIATLQPGTQARASWESELAVKQAELARRDATKQRFETEVKRAIDSEIAVAAKEHYGAVIDAAAAEAGFTVAEFGPLSREVSQEPRFDKNHDPTVVHLMRVSSNLKAGESTAVMQDFANRRWHFAVCTKVEPLQPSDVSRRRFEQERSGGGYNSFATQQAAEALRQSFTLKALEARYDLQRPVGEQRENT